VLDDELDADDDDDGIEACDDMEMEGGLDVVLLKRRSISGRSSVGKSSDAYRTGAVARPSCKSLPPDGFPKSTEVPVKSSKSSTSYMMI
jgi:hypothetical protein